MFGVPESPVMIDLLHAFGDWPLARQPAAAAGRWRRGHGAGGAGRARARILARVIRLCGSGLLLAVFAMALARFIPLEPAVGQILPRLGMPEARLGRASARATRRRRPLLDRGTRQRHADPLSGRYRGHLHHPERRGRERAGIKPDPLRLPVVMHTANGDAEAQMARVGRLRFGSIDARHLDVVVSDTSGRLNVLGMNFLNRLKGWRVEEGVLILSPRHPVAV
jgi:aspartyl protease family protein